MVVLKVLNSRGEAVSQGINAAHVLMVERFRDGECNVYMSAPTPEGGVLAVRAVGEVEDICEALAAHGALTTMLSAKQ